MALIDLLLNRPMITGFLLQQPAKQQGEPVKEIRLPGDENYDYRFNGRLPAEYQPSETRYGPSISRTISGEVTTEPPVLRMSQTVLPAPEHGSNVLRTTTVLPKPVYVEGIRFS